MRLNRLVFLAKMSVEGGLALIHAWGIFSNGVLLLKGVFTNSAWSKEEVASGRTLGAGLRPGLSPTAGPESGGVAGCGGRQSRSSLAIPRVSGRRTTTDAIEDNPDSTTWVDQRAIKPARSCLATPQRPAMG